MASAVFLRGHIVHLAVFGIPVAGLVGVVVLQEIRGRWGNSVPRIFAPEHAPGVRMAAAGLLAAAAIHAVVIPEHFRESLLYGGFFCMLAAAQIVVAVWLTVRPDYPMLRLVAVASLWVVGLYLVSRTSGLPVGPEPWRPESFGALDIGATVAELVTLIGCVMTMRTYSTRLRMFTQRLAEAAR